MQDHYPPLVLDKINVEMLEAKGADYLGMIIAQKQEPQPETPATEDETPDKTTENNEGYFNFEKIERGIYSFFKQPAKVASKVIKKATETYNSFLATINATGEEQAQSYNITLKWKDEPIHEENYQILYRLYQFKNKKYAVFTPAASHEPPYFTLNTAMSLFKIVQHHCFTDRKTGELLTKFLPSRPDDLLIPYSVGSGSNRHWALHHIRPNYNESKKQNNAIILCIDPAASFNKPYDLSHSINVLQRSIANYHRDKPNIKHTGQLADAGSEDSGPWLVQNISTILDQIEPSNQDSLDKAKQMEWFTKHKNFVAPVPSFMERNKYKIIIFSAIILSGLAVGIAFALLPELLAPLLYAGAIKIGIDLSALGTLSALQLGLFMATIATLASTAIMTTVLLLAKAIGAIFKVASKSPLEDIALPEIKQPKAEDFKTPETPTNGQEAHQKEAEQAKTFTTPFVTRSK